jgi:hypothetical protein
MAKKQPKYEVKSASVMIIATGTYLRVTTNLGTHQFLMPDGSKSVLEGIQQRVVETKKTAEQWQRQLQLISAVSAYVEAHTQSNRAKGHR